MGIETFLDEKDIATGDSIDEEIQNQLRECDELLLLLSPSALTSNWVMIEVGGAKALGIRLVPILLHVGANEVPSPISNHLLRDLNEIDRYYKEVRSRLAGATDEEISELRGPREAMQPFAKGDHVVIVGTVTSEIQRGDAFLRWLPGMEEYLGKNEVVSEADSDGTVRLGGAPFWWAVEWLRKA